MGKQQKKVYRVNVSDFPKYAGNYTFNYNGNKYTGNSFYEYFQNKYPKNNNGTFLITSGVIPNGMPYETVYLDQNGNEINKNNKKISNQVNNFAINENNPVQLGEVVVTAKQTEEGKRKAEELKQQELEQERAAEELAYQNWLNNPKGEINISQPATMNFISQKVLQDTGLDFTNRYFTGSAYSQNYLNNLHSPEMRKWDYFGLSLLAPSAMFALPALAPVATTANTLLTPSTYTTLMGLPTWVGTVANTGTAGYFMKNAIEDLIEDPKDWKNYLQLAASAIPFSRYGTRADVPGKFIAKGMEKISPTAASKYRFNLLDNQLLADGANIKSIGALGNTMPLVNRISMTSSTKPIKHTNDLFPFQPNSHLQGEQAAEMIKDMQDVFVPNDSPLFERLLKYAPEARIRYGLTDDITDTQIARALYKSSVRDFKGTAASNSLGEPLVLFRGDNKPYTKLIKRPSPNELVSMSGTMDNGFGTLFLGDFGKLSLTQGLERYLTGWKLNTGGQWDRVGSWDGFTPDMPQIPNVEGSWRMYFGPAADSRLGNYVGFVKAPSKYSTTGVNDINAFMVHTPNVRDASKEISVLSDDFLSMQNTWRGPKVLNGEHPTRQQVAEHIQNVLDDAKLNNQGLLKSSKIDPSKGITSDNILREEHGIYDYYAVPNFNLPGVKHVLQYDLRLPRIFSSDNIYFKQGGQINHSKTNV